MADFHSKLHGKASRNPERDSARLVYSFREFIHKQKTTSTLLLLSTLITLNITNSPLAGTCHAPIGTRIRFVPGDSDYAMSLHHRVYHGVMVLFFLFAGLSLLCGLCCSTSNDPDVNMTMYRG